MFIETYATIWKMNEKDGHYTGQFSESGKDKDGKMVTNVSDWCAVKDEVVDKIAEAWEDNKAFGKAKFILTNKYDKEKKKTYYNFYLYDFERYEKKKKDDRPF